jgi:hypothetical protein
LFWAELASQIYDYNNWFLVCYCVSCLILMLIIEQKIVSRMVESFIGEEGHQNFETSSYIIGHCILYFSANGIFGLKGIERYLLAL